ncbi:MAG: CPBP family intramembrane metalloprotease [Actinobacteria bacterium]|nr:CPBP family intramembrane metalloprotease [Actinomycetota bacterium]
MSVVGAILAIVIVLVLPVRGWLSHRRLDAMMDDDPAEPMRTFRRSAFVKWTLTAIALAVLAGDGRLGIIWFGDKVAVLFPLAFVVVFATYQLRLRLQSAEGQADIVQQLERVSALLPATGAERRAWVWLSVTAGMTEEVLYRAFLLVYLYSIVPWLGLAGAAVLAGMAFAVVHAYQGWRAMVLTGLIGVALGLLYPWAGLIVLMFLHTLFDLRLLLVPPGLVQQARADRRGR